MTQTILVTGASSGIGRATAVELAGRGHRVIAAARRTDLLDRLAEETAGSIVPLQLDVADRDSIRTAMARLEESQPGGIDVLVNNAGFSLIGALETLSSEDIERQYATNVLGVIEMSRAVLPGFRTRGSGRIINVSSVLGRMAFPGSGVYCSSKFAVEALSDALRMEVRPFGIDVVTVEPGFTTTEIDVGPRPSAHRVAAYDQLTARLGRYTEHEKERGVPAEKVARVIADAAVKRRPQARYVLPRRYGALIAMLDGLPVRVADRLKLAQLPSAA